ncbi:MAG TPA: DUF1501 domain-containing protein, partial [Urbifossiella sp.]
MPAPSANRIGCDDFRDHLRLNRRGFVTAGLLGAAGIGLGDVLRAEEKKTSASRINTVLLLWMRGGPSHIDMWDPKPDAPSEYRGEFGTIGTSVPGIRLGDMLPLSAKIMHKWSIVRSLNHHDAGH